MAADTEVLTGDEKFAAGAVAVRSGADLTTPDGRAEEMRHLVTASDDAWDEFLVILKQSFLSEDHKHAHNGAAYDHFGQYVEAEVFSKVKPPESREVRAQWFYALLETGVNQSQAAKIARIPPATANRWVAALTAETKQLELEAAAKDAADAAAKAKRDATAAEKRATEAEAKKAADAEDRRKAAEKAERQRDAAQRKADAAKAKATKPVAKPKCSATESTGTRGHPRQCKLDPGHTGDHDFGRGTATATATPQTPATEPSPPAATDGEQAFPSWASQVRKWNDLTAEMIDQANYKQTGDFDKMLTKMTRANLSKRQDLEPLEAKN